MSDNDTSQTKQERKPGRPKAPDYTEEIMELQDKLQVLQNVIIKMAHFSGTQRIILEAGLEPFVPGKQDMGKYK